MKKKVRLLTSTIECKVFYAFNYSFLGCKVVMLDLSWWWVASERPGWCTSSLKKALNPAIDETGTRKKVSVTDRGNKSTASGSKTPSGFRKGDLEPPVVDVAKLKGKKVTRSSIKRT
jgi:hypothetical protein